MALAIAGPVSLSTMGRPKPAQAQTVQAGVFRPSREQWPSLSAVADGLDALARHGQVLAAAETGQAAADHSLQFARTQWALGRIAALFQAMGGGWAEPETDRR